MSVIDLVLKVDAVREKGTTGHQPFCFFGGRRFLCQIFAPMLEGELKGNLVNAVPYLM